MEFKLEEAVSILSSTPRAVRTMLEGMDDAWVRSNYGPETFSPFDVVGHLIHGEQADWIPRARIILQHGEQRAFEPFDRYAMYEADKGKSMADLLDTFARLRSESLEALASFDLSEEKLSLRGTHPELGVVTMRQLLATWVVHDLNHVHQIAKCLGYQYRSELGPWRTYLTFMDR